MRSTGIPNRPVGEMDSHITLEKLTKRDVVKAIDFEGPARLPIVMPLVCDQALLEQHGPILQDLIKKYPGDVAFTNVHVDYWNGLDNDPDYRWAFGSKTKPTDVGMDVQKLIPSGTPDEVAAGVTERARLFYRPQGGVLYGAANVIVSGTPLENIVAYVNSLYRFCAEVGVSHVSQN